MTGTERVRERFETLRSEGRRGLMPFIVGGHPSLGELGAVLRAIDAAGATAIEIGLPFSDPIADGPVIASAMHDALGAGVGVVDVLGTISNVSSGLDAPLVAMVSVSIAMRFGVDRFAEMLADAGLSGVIFPDAPLEEAGLVSEASRAAGLTCSLLVAPTTPDDRAAQIARASTGFVYLVARAGITGTQTEDPSAALAGRISEMRRTTDLPIACGFGISTARHVRMVTEHADAAIVGSALVRRLSDAAGAGDDSAIAAGGFTAELATGLTSTADSS